MIYPRFRLYTRFLQYLQAFVYILGFRRYRGTRQTLEQTLAADLQREVVVFNQCRVGIYHVLNELIRRTGRQEVLMSPYTLFDVVNMVIAAGGIPRFIDVDGESLHPGLGSFSKALRKKKNVVAALVTHYHQAAPDLAGIHALLKKSGIPLLEDCAIAFGGSYRGSKLGAIGEYSFFSFGRMKNVSTFFGGAVASRDSSMIEHLEQVDAGYPSITRMQIFKALIYSLIIETITHPITWTLFFHHFFAYGYKNQVRWIEFLIRPDKDIALKTELPDSYKLRISDVQCAMILRGLKREKSDRLKRVALARLYSEQLGGLEGIVVPCEPVLESDPMLEFPVLAEDRDQLFLRLQSAGIDCRKYYYRDCASLPAFQQYAAPCPRVRELEDSLIMLSVYPGYPIRRARRAARIIRESHRAKA